jgi:antitoxin component of MazEF toxin-antitoxin module
MDIKITKIGGSNYIIVPSEFVKVYNLNKYIYNIEVSLDGKTLVYKQVSEDNEVQKEKSE